MGISFRRIPPDKQDRATRDDRLARDPYPCVALSEFAMRHEGNNFAIADAPGLRCVWAASEDENGPILKAHWIVWPTETQKSSLVGEPGFMQKGGETCWAAILYFVWDSR